MSRVPRFDRETPAGGAAGPAGAAGSARPAAESAASRALSAALATPPALLLASTPRPTRAQMATATQERLDPLAGLAAWPIVPSIAAIVTVYAGLATFLQRGQITDGYFAGLALAFVFTAAVTLVVAARPGRAPLSRTAAVGIVALALLGYILEQASYWGQNALVQDDFGPVCIGLLLLALAPFRPWRDIVGLAAVAAVAVGVGAIGQADTLIIEVPAGVFAVVATTQLLAPALAGAAYSRQVVRSLLAWQAVSRRATRLRTEESRGLLAQSVIDHRLGTLGEDVLPFLQRVLQQSSVTEADVARAGVLAAEVRQIFGALVDRTWLDAAVLRERQALIARGHTPQITVADPEQVAGEFTAEQRAAVTALMSAICARPGFDPGSLTVRLDHNLVRIDAHFALTARQVRRILRPYRAVLGVVCGRVRVAHRNDVVTVTVDMARPNQN